MWNIAPKTLVVFWIITFAKGDYEVWLEGQNITSNLSETGVNLTETLCVADVIKVKRIMEQLDIRRLQCATKLQTLLIDNVGLLRITHESLESLPPSVKNLSIVRNSVKKINAELFSNLTIANLNLSSNAIEIIVPNAFDYMKNLVSIVLDHNDITVYNLSFVECPKLKVISLRYNFIKQLSEGMLHYLKHNVLSVFLSYNNIKEVHKSALDIKQFHEVHLDHNELPNAQLLIKLVKAEIVDLSENHITCLPKEFMENGLSKIKMLNLSGNPLECNCLQDLQRKVRKNIEFQKMSPLVQNINIILPKNKTNAC